MHEKVNQTKQQQNNNNNNREKNDCLQEKEKHTQKNNTHEHHNHAPQTKKVKSWKLNPNTITILRVIILVAKR